MERADAWTHEEMILVLNSMLSSIHKSFRKNAWLFGRKAVYLQHTIATLKV